MMAFVGACLPDAQVAVLDAQRRAIGADDDNAEFTREVGGAATQAMRVFGRGDPALAVRLLRSIRSTANRFGGSHAQRDVIDLTLVEAALRAQDAPLAAALAAERLARRPSSPLARRFVARAGQLRAVNLDEPLAATQGGRRAMALDEVGLS